MQISEYGKLNTTGDTAGSQTCTGIGNEYNPLKEIDKYGRTNVY